MPFLDSSPRVRLTFCDSAWIVLARRLSAPAVFSFVMLMGMASPLIAESPALAEASPRVDKRGFFWRLFGHRSEPTPKSDASENTVARESRRDGSSSSRQKTANSSGSKAKSFSSSKSKPSSAHSSGAAEHEEESKEAQHSDHRSEGQSKDPAVPTVTPAAAVSEVPFGKPVPGRPGMVYLPGMKPQPENMLDVRDIAPGTTVRDPVSKIIFRVP